MVIEGDPVAAEAEAVDVGPVDRNGGQQLDEAPPQLPKRKRSRSSHPPWWHGLDLHEMDIVSTNSPLRR